MVVTPAMVGARQGVPPCRSLRGNASSRVRSRFVTRTAVRSCRKLENTSVIRDLTSSYAGN
jgi:hypothetical protein